MNRREFLAAAAAALPLSALAAESTRTWRVGVIGHTGRGNYGHGLDTMWLLMPETEIVGVADADPAGLAQAGQRLRTDRTFGDYRALLDETKPDIVAICSRDTDQHRDMLLAAVDAGARGIYIEKCFCRTLTEADEMVAACDRSGVKCAVAHRNRWHPAMPAVQQFIADGGLGKLLEIRTRGKEDDRGGCEDLWVLGSHPLNLAHAFAGDPVACATTILQDGRPIDPTDFREGGDAIGLIAGNELHARFETESGVPVFFDSIRRAGIPVTGFGLQLIGVKGIIDLKVDQPSFAHWCPGNPFNPTDQPRAWTPISSAGVGEPEQLSNVREEVATHVLPARDLLASIEENRQPLCSARDGATTIEMIAGAYASHRVGGGRIALPLTDRGHPWAGWQA
ncbi:MAG: Gfo/Idh/MocA family oxidoreductase [Planctomyces sp.]|nr:Gfo/Idh/MocA family oxidoreductase [Planctomyces sp.]